ncbi:pre-peptidase C-terminal domain-containing protein [Aliikangiella coralliicola]|uniref:Trypsin-like serine protease n=1 Tax=Aliikangiella coralliicola TaxID=2592383 RepID=A0A545UE62_9GAMM|nr:pre-peptidase C-terminal domain-containing protein [Aliikangiella coralliicola]TQV87751.1 trypsin-like serine protease [Aliikangiella coralliicola]
MIIINNQSTNNIKVKNKPPSLQTLLRGTAIGCGLLGLSLGINAETLSASSGLSDVEMNIVNGTETTPGSRSYQAMLVKNGQQWCGGTLIADSWVLTAAHCLDNSSAGSWTVRLGSHTVNSGTSHNVSQMVVHPNWQGSGGIQYGYDIALLKLSSPAASNLTRALLPTQAIQNAIAGVGDNVTVSGWGRTYNGGPSSNVLLEVDLPVLSTQQCKQQLDNAINDSVICGGGPNGKSACNGDSGGPFVARQNGIAYSFGTVSWGKACSGATAFTRTLSYVDWINDKIGGTPPPPPPGDTELVNGTGVSVSGAQGSNKYYTLTVPAGATNLKFVTSGGSGDLDMYVKFGSQPTSSSYDCRPYQNGNNETCTISNIQAGTYHVMLNGYSAYSGATLTGSYDGDTPPPPPPGDSELTNGQSVNVSGAQGSNTYYTLQVPSGATNLKFVTSGGTGDLDLFVKFGSKPTASSYDCRPYQNGNNETCTISNVQAGTYHVMLNGYAAYSGATLTASYDDDVTPPPNDNELSNGVAVFADATKTYTMNVPAGSSNLSFAISGGSGDADLYVKYGSAPTNNSYDCRPYLNGNNETCSIPNVQAGTYYIVVKAYQPYSNVSLVGSHN